MIIGDINFPALIFHGWNELDCVGAIRIYMRSVPRLGIFRLKPLSLVMALPRSVLKWMYGASVLSSINAFMGRG